MNKGRGNNLYQEGIWPKNGNRRSKWLKNGDRWSRSTITNWNMKKSVWAVKNIDKDGKPKRTAQKEANTRTARDTEESIKWNEKLNRLQEAITGLENIAQKGIVAQLSPVL